MKSALVAAEVGTVFPMFKINQFKKKNFKRGKEQTF